MASPDKAYRVEVKDDGQTVAAAEVRTVEHPAGTVRPLSGAVRSSYRPPAGRR